MADCNNLVPIIIRWEAGVTAEGLTNKQLFEKARAKGFVNDPLDRGGATLTGVTLNTYKAYCKATGKPAPGIAELKAMPYEDWYAMLKTRYWDVMKADYISNQSIANLCVNTIWGSGSSYVKVIQGVLGVKQDGQVGPVTLAKMNGWVTQKGLFDRLWARRKQYFDNLVARSVADYERKIGRKATEQELLKHTQKRFLKGWMNRLNSFQYAEQ